MITVLLVVEVGGFVPSDDLEPLQRVTGQRQNDTSCYRRVAAQASGTPIQLTTAH